MARKGQAAFQLEINSDEEWKLLLQKPGLIVADVYSEWCGPCIAMKESLKKIKVDVNNDYLILALANASKITDLRRFNGTSEPTWLFIASNQLLRVMYGCNSPILTKAIMDEFEHELRCIEGLAKRFERPLQKLTPEEEAKIEAKKLILNKECKEKKKEVAIQWDKIRHRYYEKVARNLTNLSVVVFFPHTMEVSDEGKELCPPSNKLQGQYDVARVNIKDQLEVQLTKETISKLFYNSGVLFPKILLRSLEQQPVIAALLQEYEPPPRESALRKTASGIKEAIDEHLDEIEQKIAHVAYGDSMNPLDPSPKSVCYQYMFFTPKGTAVPPFWTPREHVSKAAAIEVLFPALVEELEIKLEPLPPPSYVAIFEARRAREVLDAAHQFAPSVRHVGFFDSENPKEAEMICKTVHEYERLPRAQKLGLKIVIAVERTSSDPMLILAQLGPLHMSEEKEGLKEVEAFFPPKIDEVIEPDPWGPPPEDDYKGDQVEEEAVGEEMSEEMVEEEVVKEKEVDIAVDEGPPPSTVVPPPPVMEPSADDLEGVEEVVEEEEKD